MLLKMRSLPPRASPRPDNGILRAVEGSDENAVNWFESLRLTREYLCLFIWYMANDNSSIP